MERRRAGAGTGRNSNGGGGQLARRAEKQSRGGALRKKTRTKVQIGKSIGGFLESKFFSQFLNSNAKTHKIRNVELKEFYNFAFGGNSKRSRFLKLFQNQSNCLFSNKSYLTFTLSKEPLNVFSLITVVKKLKTCFMHLSPSQTLKLLFKPALLQKQP